jgi:hypothetical protein
MLDVTSVVPTRSIDLRVVEHLDDRRRTAAMRGRRS